ncbi:Hypothetical predicted protein [Olea europaea subsp. europaea]|uniref:Uncharacterized protein n=1 Tax=Olea europaea subsp. europaea TaxID=158383 RepID=A0A8S0RW94_OLEEU|nr:Hypothetical predicted protein [Olea europaea subsp. europaea]
MLMFTIGNKMTYPGESSNQGYKKSKRAKQASIVAATREGNEGIRLSEGGSNSVLDVRENDVVEGLRNSASTTENKKNGRGRAKLNYLNKGKCAKLSVEFNERGQPICKGSNKLSSFIGTTTRELIPITWKNWKDMSKEFPDDIWEHVQQKFDVDACHGKYIMQKMGKN